MLLVIAGLFVRTTANLQAAETGFDTTGLTVAAFDLGRLRIEAGAGRETLASLLEALRGQPGVAAATVANTVPLSVGKDEMQIRVPGFVLPDGATSVRLSYAVVGSRYFETLRIPLVAGTAWTGSFRDPAGPPPGIVVNETMARRYWPAGNAVGSTVEVVGRGVVRVLGVARDTTYYAIGEAPLPFMYLPAEAVGLRSFAVFVRMSSPGVDARATLSRAIAVTDRRLVPHAIGRLDDLRDVSSYPARAFGVTSAALGLMALLLTAVGVYGVLSAVVGQRTREIGVRMALGAPRARVLGGVIGDAAALAIAGAVAGAFGAYWAARALSGWLFGVAPFDPVVSAGTALVIIAASLAAAWLPARRAARVDPVVALRAS
jgi:hypothetical protein